MKFSSSRIRYGVVAFSLVELMVVVLIVSVLMALGFSVMRGGRANAEKARCVAHLRQAGQEVLMLMGENDQVLEVFARGAPEVKMWGRRIAIEVNQKEREHLRCPSAPVAFAIDHVNWYWSTYGINVFDPQGVRSSDVRPGEYLYRVAVVNVESPAQFLLLADSGGKGKNADGERTQVFRLDNATESGVVARHDGHAHLYFLDGHLESVAETRFSDYTMPYYDAEDNFHPVPTVPTTP